MPDKTPIYASESGTVIEAQIEHGYGNYIKIQHNNQVYTAYAHLYQINVSVGQRVERGQLIALSGGVAGRVTSGTSTGPHLHFEVYIGGRTHNYRVDPLSCLSNIDEHLYYYT